MGYEHSWKLDKVMTREQYRNIVRDFRIILPHLEVKKGLIKDGNQNRYIRDHSIINDETIMFNAEAEGEAFRFKRTGYETLQNSCKTNNLPFDVAVNVVLLIAKKHLRHDIHITTDGETKHWRKALLLCQYALGDEYFYMHITKKNNMVRYRFWDMDKNPQTEMTETFEAVGFKTDYYVFTKTVPNGYVTVTCEVNMKAPASIDDQVALVLNDNDGNLIETTSYESSKVMLNDTYFNWITNL